MQGLPNLNIITNIEINCRTENELKSLRDSLYPDNIDFPENLILDMKTSNLSLSLNFKFIKNETKANSIDTLLNTVDEIMEHIGIILNVINND